MANSYSGPSQAYIKWYEERASTETGSHRAMRVAWLVRDIVDRLGERQQMLAYLGERPLVTRDLMWEVSELYPELAVDWEEVQRQLAADATFTDAAALSDDELAVRLRALARERGLSLMDLALRLGHQNRHVLPELEALLSDLRNVARIERTSGSIFRYLAQKHPDYAFLVYKARLFFEGRLEELEHAAAAEPLGYGSDAWRARRRYWGDVLGTYLKESGRE